MYLIKTNKLPFFYLCSIGMLLTTKANLWIFIVFILTLFYIIKLIKAIKGQTLLNIEFIIDFQLCNLKIICQRDESTEFMLKWTVIEREEVTKDDDIHEYNNDPSIDTNEEEDDDTKSSSIKEIIHRHRKRTVSHLITIIGCWLIVLISYIVWLFQFSGCTLGLSIVSIICVALICNNILTSYYNLRLTLRSSLFTYSAIFIDEYTTEPTWFFKKLNRISTVTEPEIREETELVLSKEDMNDYLNYKAFQKIHSEWFKEHSR